MNDNEMIDMYCVTNRRLKFLENFDYNLSWVGNEEYSKNYITCNTNDNIFYKEKYYSELTFHYWYWKNMLNLKENKWIGFCQKRRFWIKPESEGKTINIDNINDHLLLIMPNEWKKYDAIVCKPINVSGAKKIKILKRGWRSIIKDPLILFNKHRENIHLHFDMHHGHGNMDKAIEMLDDNDRDEFKKFVKTNQFFNPHLMFIAKPKITNEWFTKLFFWLEKCEKKIGFKSLAGYDTTRLYAYLAERYLSFWFKKYTNYLESPWVFIDN